MNINVTGWGSQQRFPVYNIAGTAIARGTPLGLVSVVRVVDSASPTKFSLIPKVVNIYNADPGVCGYAYCGVAEDDIPPGTLMDDPADEVAIYYHDGIGPCLELGIGKVLLGADGITIGEELYLSLDAAHGVVDVDGVVGATDLSEGIFIRIGVALEAGDTSAVVDAFILPPLYLDYPPN